MTIDFDHCIADERDSPEHDWIDVTPIGSADRVELCKNCSAKRRTANAFTIQTDERIPPGNAVVAADGEIQAVITNLERD